ncbi:p87 capsid protein [Orgyia pseudotsugata multiple nucleopolyhedrovirus]|uniref:Capsid protein p87 n=1 Tax=Orgyia pseudotsugata multicapsid polyhedrosis virus TaxID=262177 RepID=VP87_NPVOP|nr:p87 capsid protein [Orgyia pseudotsugata multiple nucleopolyhedrovirus]P17930.1 RecName: Full=Capsid protein p87 [Orgyia pseudotsugata multiple nucleopolyhedrovirus]pir/T10374/ p87 capsid protein - Orgyia pseudotsugata nuclear polyhedrosis virus [Orgyia pseudotsugata single capsid nuclopolyhedrovirus]AAC59104.1 p87 capsid protein [Orgyia pseudotsugata multiple nucleopolyhedrovirus]BAA03061.1 p87 capsid protein [Orgyia pseudotsugata single capsid nuclopolyhedrovirus]
MDEQHSLRIAALAGEILTRDRAQVNTIIHSPERALGQKLDAITALVDSMQPGTPRDAAVNEAANVTAQSPMSETQDPQRANDNVSDTVANENAQNLLLEGQDRVLRHRVLQIAVTFLQRNKRVKANATTLAQIEEALRNYETAKNSGASDSVIDGFLERAESLFNTLKNISLSELLDRESAVFADTESAPRTQTADNSPPPVSEQDFDRLDISQLTDYIENNYRDQFDFDKHNSVEDVRNFAKNLWRNKTRVTSTPLQEYQMPPQTPAPLQDQMPPQTPAYATPAQQPSQPTPAQTPAQQPSQPTPAYVTSAQTPAQQPSQPTPVSNYSWERRVASMFANTDLPQNVPLPDSYDTSSVIGQKRRKRRAPPLPPYSSDEEDAAPPRSPKRKESLSSSEEDEFDYEREQKRRREEDKNFLRLKALELSKYAGVNERMEKIVRVTKAMQQTYDYCNCKNTISGTPAAASFINLLRRLNTYNLSHVEMTVNFYELLYPLTLYNDESNRIVGYIFAATNYFQNCAKNFGRMRAEFNEHGPFAQIDSLVMFVIKFNFLCDLQTFFGKIDGLPMLAQPNIKTHTVLVMRDKIVKLAFGALQYDTSLKTDNRRDPKHLQRLIQLMNADFNIM